MILNIQLISYITFILYNISLYGNAFVFYKPATNRYISSCTNDICNLITFEEYKRLKELEQKEYWSNINTRWGNYTSTLNKPG
jgi:hypothetical protein